MSFARMKRDDLYEMAVKQFAVEVSDTATKPIILAALAENGVTWRMAKTFDKNAAALALENGDLDEDEDDILESNVITSETINKREDVKLLEVEEKPTSVSVKAQEQMLIAMDRENPTYEVRGYRFTKTHPFALVNGSDVQFVLDHEEGFRQASPREVEEFYG